MTARTGYQRAALEIRYFPEDRAAEVFMLAHSGDPSGYLTPDKMVLVDEPCFEWKRRVPNHPRSLDKIYRVYQTIDGQADERTQTIKQRSMTVGDAIVIDNVAYYVAPDGFVTVKDGEIVPVSDED